MKQVPVLVFFIGSCLTLPLRALSQNTPADSAFLQQAIANISMAYKKETAENLHLYNGSEYLRQGHGVKGFPFFQSAGMLKGDVFYDGSLYHDVSMQYDLEEDNLVISDYSGNVFIRLVKEKVQYFIIDGHRFVHLGAGAGLPADGFYESLYNGKLNAYARRQKKTIQALNPADEGYRLYNTWLVEKQGAFFTVAGEGSVLEILSDKKDLLKKYIRSDKLKFKKTPEIFLARVAGYYDQLNN
jgi:hypothetical protein